MAGNSGANKLARVLYQKMKATNQNRDQLELGRILADFSLQTDYFPIPIKKGDYLITRQLSFDIEAPLTQTIKGQGNHPHGPSGNHSQYRDTGEHMHPEDEGEHIHDIILPKKMYPLEPGDRVLVAWLNQGTDVIVLDIIGSS